MAAAASCALNQFKSQEQNRKVKEGEMNVMEEEDDDSGGGREERRGEGETKLLK